MRVFAVWEPILLSDWSKPGSNALARLSDPRVAHFWDRQHAVARQLAKDARAPQPEPECCLKNDTLWDLVAVYPPDRLWTETIPPAVLFDGPVWKKQSNIESVLQP